MRQLVPVISLIVVSLVGLGFVIGPPIAYLFGLAGKYTMTTLMLVGTVVWFVSAPFWMGRSASSESAAGQHRPEGR